MGFVTVVVLVVVDAAITALVAERSSSSPESPAPRVTLPAFEPPRLFSLASGLPRIFSPRTVLRLLTVTAVAVQAVRSLERPPELGLG